MTLQSKKEPLRVALRLLAVMLLLTGGADLRAQTLTSVVLSESDEAFPNPMKGFRPSVHLGERNFVEHEYATVYKHYIKYSDLETSSEDKAQRIKDWSNRAWAGIEFRNIKVIPRVVIIYPDGPDGGTEGYWPVDLPHDGTPDQWLSPIVRARLVRFVQKLGEAWDNDPRVAAVEMGLVGKWGEHHIYPETFPGGTDRIPDGLQTALGNAFQKAFKNKKVMIRYPETFTGYAFGQYWDSFALPDDQTGGTGFAARDSWRTQMMSGEVAYDWGDQSLLGGQPDNTLKNPLAVTYVIDWIRRTHTSSLGWISGYNRRNPSVAAGASALQKAFGYRLVVKEARYSTSTLPGGKLELEFVVANTGNAPFYYRWPVQASLLAADRSVAWSGIVDTDIRTWLPGTENTVTAAFSLPPTLPRGTYVIALAVLDPDADKPSLRFANTNYYSGGHTPLGLAGVGQQPADRALGPFDGLKNDRSLGYGSGAPPAPEPSSVRPAGFLEAVNGLLGGSAVISGEWVGYVGNGSGSLQFDSKPLPAAGWYKLVINYGLSGERSAFLAVNGGKRLKIDFSSTGGWTTEGTKTVRIALSAGVNKLVFDNPEGWAPDFMGISIEPDSGAQP